jgi:hypothetical protein
MITFLRIFAYLCIWTTPLQVAIVVWGIVIVVSSLFIRNPDSQTQNTW